MKALDDREYEPEVAADQLFACRLVARMRLAEQTGHFVCRDDRQGCGVDATDLHFALHDKSLLPCLLQEVCPGTGGDIPAIFFPARPDSAEFDWEIVL